jgi:hypothetical protein
MNQLITKTLSEASFNTFYKHIEQKLITPFENYADYYQHESRDFLYRNRYVNKKRSLKIAGRVNALRMNLQLNDVEATIYNDLKTYFALDTRLCKYLKTNKKYLPLSDLGIRKRSFQPGWYKYSNLLYHTTHDMPFRNLMLVAKDKQVATTAFIRRVRPLNKSLMYNIISNSFQISKDSPLYIACKHRRKSYFSMLYLGFKFWCHYKRLQTTKLLFYKAMIKRLLFNKHRAIRFFYPPEIYSIRRLRGRYKWLKRELKRIKKRKKRSYVVHRNVKSRFIAYLNKRVNTTLVKKSNMVRQIVENAFKKYKKGILRSKSFTLRRFSNKLIKKQSRREIRKAGYVLQESIWEFPINFNYNYYVNCHLLDQKIRLKKYLNITKKTEQILSFERSYKFVSRFFYNGKTKKKIKKYLRRRKLYKIVNHIRRRLT